MSSGGSRQGEGAFDLEGQHLLVGRQEQQIDPVNPVLDDLPDELKPVLGEEKLRDAFSHLAGNASESSALGYRNRGKATPTRSREERVGGTIQINALCDRLLWHGHWRRCAERLSERKGRWHLP